MSVKVGKSSFLFSGTGLSRSSQLTKHSDSIKPITGETISCAEVPSCRTSADLVKHVKSGAHLLPGAAYNSQLVGARS